MWRVSNIWIKNMMLIFYIFFFRWSIQSIQSFKHYINKIPGLLHTNIFTAVLQIKPFEITYMVHLLLCVQNTRKKFIGNLVEIYVWHIMTLIKCHSSRDTCMTHHGTVIKCHSSRYMYDKSWQCHKMSF